MALKPSLGLLRGCRAIARFLHGDDEHWRLVPALARSGFPIFKLEGQWTARAEALAEEIARREQRARSASADAEALPASRPTAPKAAIQTKRPRGRPRKILGENHSHT